MASCLYQWTNSACLGLPLQPPVPLQSACWSPHCLPGGARGRRSGRGWGHSCSSPGLHFLPQPWAPGAEEAQAGRPELPPVREAYRALPTTPQPSCPQRLSIMDLHLVLVFLVCGPPAAYVAICPALPALPCDARRHSPSLILAASV